MGYNFETRAIHDGQEPDKETGAVIPPIHVSSTFQQKEVGIHSGYEYSRTHNPTRDRLERQVASLENASQGIAFASGSAATSSILLLLEKGSHVICGDDVYGGTYRFFDKVMTKFGVEFDFVDLTNPTNLINTIKPNTSMVWLETPTNPLLKVSDLDSLNSIAKENSLITVVDNTFATPYIQQPLGIGVDLVIHSSTKYLGGHSDVVGGIVLTNDEKLANQLRFIQNSAGAIPSPFDCWLVSRGIKTLALRVEKHSENAKKVVEFLIDHPKVKHVYYPFLETHKNVKVAKKQMKLGGGMVSFEVETKDMALDVLASLKVFTLAESLGGVESLAEYPPTMTHGSIELERRHEIGINDGLVRLSIGIEHIDDLISDLESSLSKI